MFKRIILRCSKKGVIMNIEGIEEHKNKKNKTATIILVCIILLVLAIIGIVFFMLAVQNMTLKVYINGKLVTLNNNIVIVDNNTDKVYVSIKDIAPYLDYEAHNGEYKVFSEDTNKCWVNTKRETASFFLNSNKICKVYPDQTRDYEEYRIDEPVVEKNGRLYTTAEGIQIGFNSIFAYDKTANTITINTLPNLVERYTTIMKNYGYAGVSSDFDNQKAILYNLFIVKKSNGLYGVVDAKNQEIISSKYQSMLFNENTQEFSVRSTTNKVGIVTKTGETKINLTYDSITVLDKDSELYVVRTDNKYGVVDGRGNSVIYAEYDQIGVTSNNFQADNISNKYLLFDSLIPVYKDKKWGAFDKTGKIVIPIEYDAMGYTSTKVGSKVINPLLIIPSYKAIVVGKRNEEERKNYYGIIDYTGKQLVPIALENAFSTTSEGENTYYMTYNGKEMNIEDYIKKYVFPTDEQNGTSESQQNQVTQNGTQTQNQNQVQSENKMAQNEVNENNE